MPLNSFVVPPIPALSYVDDGGPENMNVPHPTWISQYNPAETGTPYYVDQVNGNDAQSGLSYALSKKTLAAAFATAPANSTINVADGVYLEGELALNKAMTIQAYFANVGRAILDARQDLSIAAGATWTKDGAATRWYTTFNSPATYADGVVAGGAPGTNWSVLQQNGGNNGSFTTTDPNCVYAMPMTIDGQIIKGVGTAAAVDATHHFHDHAALRLYIGIDPTGHTIKAPIWRFAVALTAAVTLRGLVFRCYAAAYAVSAATIQAASGAYVIDNCTVGFSASDGINVGGGSTAGTIRHTHSVYNLVGFSMQSGVNGHTYDDCLAHKNNIIWRYCQAWHAGGFKCAGVDNTVGTWCVATENVGTGFWRDFSQSDNWWINCLARDNTDNAALDEKTYAINNTTRASGFLGCVFMGSWAGLFLAGAQNTVVLNCTFFNNGRSLGMSEDFRGGASGGATPPGQHNSGIVYENNLHSVTLGNTVVAGTAPIRHAYVTNNGVEAGNFTTAFSSMKNNYWHLDPGVTMALRFGWTINNSAPTDYATRAAWLAGLGSGLDASGVEDATGAGDPYLGGPQLYDWTPKPTGAHIAAGKVISLANRDRIGPWIGLADTVVPVVGAPIAVGGSGRRYSLWDTFNRADNAAVIGTSTSGQAATIHVGTWGISTNQGYSVTDADGNFLTWPAGAHDGSVWLAVSGTLASATVYRIPVLTFRGIDVSNYLEIVLQNGALNLNKYDAAVRSLLQTVAQTTTNGVLYTIRARCVGATMYIYVNGVLKLTYILAAVNAKYRVGTRVGVRLSKAGAPATAARFDSLCVSVA